MSDNQPRQSQMTELCLCVQCNMKPRMAMHFICDECWTEEELAELEKYDSAPGKEGTRL